jgi:hypothetical protein
VRYVAIVRTTGALLVVCAIAVVTAVGAGSAVQALTYHRLSAAAEFSMTIDYGDHPDATFNGEYDWTLAYTVNAIAVYDGRTVYVPRGLMVAEGLEVVDMSDLTQWGLPNRKPVRCRGTNLYIAETKDRNAVFSAGSVAVSNTGLRLKPGPAVTWNISCSATEGLGTHGLPGGPSFTIPPPARSRFNRTQRFSLGCRDSYSHGFDPPGNVNHHKFNGNVQFFVQFTPFPAEKLDATRKALRDKVGKSLPGGYATLSSRSLKSCP